MGRRILEEEQRKGFNCSRKVFETGNPCKVRWVRAGKSWRSSINVVLENISILSVRENREIVQWEEMNECTARSKVDFARVPPRDRSNEVKKGKVKELKNFVGHKAVNVRDMDKLGNTIGVRTSSPIAEPS